MIEIRLINDNDSIKELTILLNKAYKRLSDMGFMYIDSYQDENQTSKRIKDAFCYLAVENVKLVGSISYYPIDVHKEDNWYINEGVVDL